MPFAPGRVIQLRIHLYCVSSITFGVESGLCSKAIFNGVLKRLFLRPAKWTGTVLPGLTSPIKREMEKGLENAV